MKQVKLFLLDMDGTIYVEGKLIDGARQTIEQIKKSGKKVCFLTNNSSVSQDDYVDKLNKLNIPCLREQVYTSGNSCVRYLNNNHKGKSVYLVGTDKLRRQFEQEGINVVDNNGDILVVGYDTTLTYDKLTKAVQHLKRGVLYVITHGDINCPAADTYVPDVGSFVALLQASSGRLPDVNCGKPYQEMGQAIAEKFNLQSSEIAMVGDRLVTDLMFAKNNGFVAVTVLTGEATVESYEAFGVKTDYLLDSIADIGKLLK